MDAILKKRAETAQKTPRHFYKKEKDPVFVADEAINLSPMRPVPPEIHDLIYQGIPSSFLSLTPHPSFLFWGKIIIIP